jgi:hypothetical protein
MATVKAVKIADGHHGSPQGWINFVLRTKNLHYHASSIANFCSGIERALKTSQAPNQPLHDALRHRNLLVMNTQSHVIMGAVIFGRGIPAKAWAGALGGLIPDLPMFLIVLGLKLNGVPAQVIFGKIYWQNWWQVTNAIGHNFWLWSGLVILGIVNRDRLSSSAQTFDNWTRVSLFAGSALLHTTIDFFCHREDAHMSFWPISRWKFMSPVSYYDPAHYGMWFSLFEVALGLTLAFILFRQFGNKVLRVFVVFAMAMYVAVPAFFIFSIL